MNQHQPGKELPPKKFDAETETLIVGGGACGLVAALSAHEAGQEVLVIEADPLPRGSTYLSSGLIPAASTKIQKSAGIKDNFKLFAKDIQKKAHYENDPVLVNTIVKSITPTIDWLTEKQGLPFTLVDDFDYPGHSRRRMHGLPSRSGIELIDYLRSACERAGVDIICNRRVNVLFQKGNSFKGVSAKYKNLDVEKIGCKKLILACNGFGGNSKLVAKHLPEIKDATWFGHDGNRGEALLWGEEIGASLKHLSAFQGHGNVAKPHGILITWAVISEGGIQVNQNGERFWNEASGYSEAARAVLSQPNSQAFTIFDSRIAKIARQFVDFKNAEKSGAIQTAKTLEGLSNKLGLPLRNLSRTFASLETSKPDRFGRDFKGVNLKAPYYGVRVTGALFHTQGGLRVNNKSQVLRKDESPFGNLFAGGGAACGVSGKSDSGYLSGNGLLCAVALGRIAGMAT